MAMFHLAGVRKTKLQYDLASDIMAGQTFGLIGDGRCVNRRGSQEWGFLSFACSGPISRSVGLHDVCQKEE